MVKSKKEITTTSNNINTDLHFEVSYEIASNYYSSDKELKRLKEAFYKNGYGGLYELAIDITK